MSKIIRTEKPSVLPFYAAGAVGLVLCAALPVYKLWALLVVLAGAAAAFIAARRVCPPQVIEREVPFHTGSGDVDEMLTGIQKQLDTLHALNDALPDPQLSAAMDRMEKAGRSIIEVVEQAPAKAPTITCPTRSTCWNSMRSWPGRGCGEKTPLRSAARWKRTWG